MIAVMRQAAPYAGARAGPPEADDPHPRFEDKCAELYTQEKIRGFLHLYDGEEAVAVGVIPVLEKRDRIVATYREHGHALVRGVPMTTVLAEMYGKQEGCSRGRGGSMHLFDRATNFYGGNAIVGGGLPLAIGLALADHMQGEKHRHSVLLRRRRRRGRRVSRKPQSRGALGAAGIVRVREQSLRHGHGARDFANRRRIFSARPLVTGSPPRPLTEWMLSPSKPRRAGRSMQSARAASPIFSNAEPIGCARIPCSSRSFTGTRRRSKLGGRRNRSCVSRAGWRPITWCIRKR